MRISLTDAGKRFNREWIFRHVDLSFQSPLAYAITGPNGSGKSTLLQFIAGALMPSEGSINYYSDRNESIQTIYPLISIAAPYLEIIEEMTAVEFLHFHQKFKPFINGISIQEILEKAGLKESSNKQIRYYSSGMKQRIKLAQAFFTETPVLLLDEPTTNLDADGISFYADLIRDYCRNRLVIVGSNEPLEYTFCKEEINMTSLKK